MQEIKRYSLYIILGVFLLAAIVTGLVRELRVKRVVSHEEREPVYLHDVANETEEPVEERKEEEHFRGRIYRGVRIGEIDVSGKNTEEAQADVDAYIAEICDITISLHAEGLPSTEIKLSQFVPVWENRDVTDELIPLTEGQNVVERYMTEKDIEQEGLLLPLTVSFDKQIVMDYLGAMSDDENGIHINAAEGTAMIQNTIFARVAAGERDFTLPVEHLLIMENETQDAEAEGAETP